MKYTWQLSWSPKVSVTVSRRFFTHARSPRKLWMTRGNRCSDDEGTSTCWACWTTKSRQTVQIMQFRATRRKKAYVKRRSNKMPRIEKRRIDRVLHKLVNFGFLSTKWVIPTLRLSLNLVTVVRMLYLDWLCDNASEATESRIVFSTYFNIISLWNTCWRVDTKKAQGWWSVLIKTKNYRASRFDIDIRETFFIVGRESCIWWRCGYAFIMLLSPINKYSKNLIQVSE